MYACVEEKPKSLLVPTEKKRDGLFSGIEKKKGDGLAKEGCKKITWLCTLLQLRHIMSQLSCKLVL